MSAPQFSPDLVAIIDQEHAAVREVLDGCEQLSKALRNGETWPAMFGRLIVIDCLCYARNPERMMYRLAAWDRICMEYGG